MAVPLRSSDRYLQTDMAHKSTTTRTPVLLPDLTGRVAILGGRADEKTALCVGLARRQSQQQGLTLCLDGRRSRQTEVQFRLVLRNSARYEPLPPSGEISVEITQTVLSVVSQGLSETVNRPPLLLLDNVREQLDLEQTLSFVLKAGATVVEFLHSAAALAFGRYDTVLLLPAEADTAETLSRAVGYRVGAEDVLNLQAGEGWLIHLAHVYRVTLPL